MTFCSCFVQIAGYFVSAGYFSVLSSSEGFLILEVISLSTERMASSLSIMRRCMNQTELNVWYSKKDLLTVRDAADSRFIFE